MEDIDKDSQVQQHYDIYLVSSKPSRTDIASFHGQPSDDCTENSKHSLYYNDFNSYRHSDENQNVHDIDNDFIPIKQDININRNNETNIDVHSSKSAGDKGKISNDSAVSQSDMYADDHEGKFSQDNDHGQGTLTDAVIVDTVEGKGKASLCDGNEQRDPNGRPLSANQNVTYSLKKNRPEPFSTLYFEDIGCQLEAKRQEQKFSNYNRRLPYDKGKDYGTLFIFHPRDLFVLIILCSVLTTSAAKCQFAGSEVLEKENNLVMVICYDHTCSGNERWDKGTKLLHLNGPNGTDIMHGKYDIVSNGSCSMLTVKDKNPEDYVQKYQFTKGTTAITISPLGRPILSDQHQDESCVEGLEYYELNLTVKHKSEEAVFQVKEPQVDLTVNITKFISGYCESKIHILYRQTGNISIRNESSDGKIATLQLMYSARKDTETYIILTKKIADLKCKVLLILPGKAEASSIELYIPVLIAIGCIVLIIVVVVMCWKWGWIYQFRRKEPPVDDDNPLASLMQTTRGKFIQCQSKPSQ